MLVTAHGELDACNAAQFTEYVHCCAAQCRRLILDLSGVEFFGTAGFSALHMISARCADADVSWTVVPSRAVSRVLQICDPDHLLPTVESVAETVAVAPADPWEQRRLLQLVSQPCEGFGEQA
ncbi:hypothetical protein MBOT_03040 [Mycobacterium botniense]|uniref:STAS domain-containing protein n=1 Tax=Mycobacterium botniense TaxID=84962 RepID=A0A7I9XSG5_9MYCO|nr:hypothetical protein MBOT_03040 [Mycobacterium botniense]